jgi:D-2-hydroxyacid dehydrogenase (NADP+)
VPIAEQVLAMALCFATRLHVLIRAQSGGHDVRKRVYAQKFELESQTMLVLGLGDIGGTLARKARALGMGVLGVRRSGQASADCPDVFTPDHLPALLPRADHVALCLPLTEATRGIIGERELRLMKPSAYLYNVGRGVAVDGTALRRALGEGWIAGAGLDCLAPSDVPAADDPLRQMENVILGLHTSGTSPENSRRITDIFLANLERYRAGRPLLNRIDPLAGY